VEKRPLTKPEHLRDTPGTTAAYLKARPLGLAAHVLGLLAFALAAITQASVWSTPDWRISVPALAITSAAAIASLARREKAYALWISGVALAAIATVLGWFLMVAIVIAVAVILILILHSVM
jgi:hypothetical protein